eukprot:COSAG06_NODE_1712_length_8632_cov_71.258409_7_plen_66_part_00
MFFPLANSYAPTRGRQAQHTYRARHMRMQSIDDHPPRTPRASSLLLFDLTHTFHSGRDRGNERDC